MASIACPPACRLGAEDCDSQVNDPESPVSLMSVPREYKPLTQRSAILLYLLCLQGPGTKHGQSSGSREGLLQEAAFQGSLGGEALHMLSRPNTCLWDGLTCSRLAAGDRCCIQLGVQVTSGAAWNMAQACPRVSSLQHCSADAVRHQLLLQCSI